ncbi:MAG: mechanosensitive ion channel family protein, partial [Euryarchaeota archaeon]|nr:mechanosensitive ion channel family protein [Euryarchaeota archaeon]
MQTDIYTIGVIAAIAIATFVVARVINRLLRGYFRTASKKLNVEETTYAVTRHFIVAMVYLAGIILIVSSIPQ